MTKRAFLPSKRDWQFWFGLYGTLGLNLSRDNGIDYDQAQVILKLSKQILDGFPTGIEELINDRSEHSWILDHDRPIYSPSGEISRTIINKIRDLSRREQFKCPNFVKSSSFKKWEQEYGIVYEPNRIFKRNYKSDTSKRTKSEMGYRLTGAGVIASELILSVPCLLSTDNIFNHNNFFSHYEVLKNKKRMKWKRSFLEENNLICNKFHIDTINEIKEILKENEELFWNMSSSQTLLIREIHSLEELIKSDSLTQKYLKQNQDENLDSRKINPAFVTVFENRIKFAKSTLKNFLYPELEANGITLDDYNKSTPPISFEDDRSMRLHILPQKNFKNLFKGTILDKSIFFQLEYECALSCSIAILHILKKFIVNDRADFLKLMTTFKNTINTNSLENSYEKIFDQILDLLNKHGVKDARITNFNDMAHSLNGIFMAKISWHKFPQISAKRPNKNIYGNVEDEHFVLIDFLDRDRLICWEPSFSGEKFSPLFECTRKELIEANSTLESKLFINKLIYIKKP